MEALISTFHIDIKLLIAQIVNFAIVFGVLYIFALKPLTKIMKDRTAKIEKGLKDAKTNADQLDKTNSDYKKMVTNAKSEAYEIIKKANNDSEVKRQELLAKAKEEVNNIVIEGKAQLSAQKLEMIKQAKAEVIEIVAQATKKVLNTSINANIDNDLISKSIKDIKHE